MAVDMFLELDGIKGEAQDKTHVDKIDVLAWSWGLSQAGTTHMGSGSGAGKVSVQDISFTKFIDKSSPTLLLRCADGKHIKKGKLIVRKAGENPLEYIVIDFEDLIVTAVSNGGSGSEDRLTENVTLNFGKFHYKYTLQNPNGSKGTETEAKWDIPKNVPA
jgi:type VI secretion system secreted protein Hcp